MTPRTNLGLDVKVSDGRQGSLHQDRSNMQEDRCARELIHRVLEKMWSLEGKSWPQVGLGYWLTQNSLERRSLEETYC